MKQLTITLTTVVILIFSSLTTIAQLKTTIPDEVHILQNPFKPMNILVMPANIEGITAQQGDLVMAFDEDVCVGAAIVDDVTKVLNLVATSTDEVNKGYKSGQTIRLEYHSTYDNTVYELSPTKILLGSMNYEELGTLYAVFKANALGVDDNLNTTKVNIYPNPVSQQLHIVVEANTISKSEKLSLKLVSLDGSIMISNEYPANHGFINLDMAHLSAGVYILHLTSESTYLSQKVIKK